MHIISITLIFIGVFFIVLAGIGLVRMPDMYLRMSASTKASTLGLGFIVLGTAVYFNELSVTSRALAIIFFMFLTAPVSAHMIGRAGYSDGVPLWERTQLDELRGKYNVGDTELAGPPRSTEVDRVPGEG
ncbi:MAG: monovalent cation/H(+) antiporter subunit G [Anaerolineales bacterium]|nr:monovalent cation/H(+) antiporter subunit G [Anaerolineales bacterium]